MLSTNDFPPMKKITEDGVTKLQWVTKPEGATVYDEAFWVREQRWGTFVSVSADDKDLVTALTEDSCISGTRFYLKGLQEGWPEGSTRTYSGTVGGKL